MDQGFKHINDNVCFVTDIKLKEYPSLMHFFLNISVKKVKNKNQDEGKNKYLYIIIKKISNGWLFKSNSNQTCMIA